MNNELTHTLQLDGHVAPGADVQRLVDGLVQTYEKRALRAKVVQLDHARHTYAPVLDLDAGDAKPAEEDVLNARIFPMQEQEEVREALMKELDTAVENYANTIIAYSKTIHAFSVRVYFVTRSIVRTMYSQLRTLGVYTYQAWQTRRAAEHERALAMSTVPVSDMAPIPVPVYATIPTEVQHTAPETLTYTYGSLDALYAQDETPRIVFEPTSYAVHTDMPEMHAEPYTEAPSSLNGVAHCLYLQFRYGPSNLRQ